MVYNVCSEVHSSRIIPRDFTQPVPNHLKKNVLKYLRMLAKAFFFLNFKVFYFEFKSIKNLFLCKNYIVF